MDTVYLICEDIDLGYHVIGVYSDKTKAECQCAILNEDTKEKTIKHLVKCWGCTQELAEAEANDKVSFFIKEYHIIV
jgi:hypothetical protein